VVVGAAAASERQYVIPPMSAGFSFSGKVYWTTNGLVETLVGSLADEAQKLIGRDDPMTVYFRESFEGYYSGFVAYLDEWAVDDEKKSQLLQIMGAAVDDLLRRKVFTDYGDTWLNTEFRQLRESVANDQAAG